VEVSRASSQVAIGVALAEILRYRGEFSTTGFSGKF